MQLHFNAISEPTQPGPKWQKNFNLYWPAYLAWLNSKNAAHLPNLETSKAALKYYMPEMLPTYERLCKLANADEIAARFLTGFQPPAYISACSQAVLTERTVQLVRNYDYHPDLVEGAQLLTAWNGKKVIGTSDCLTGLVDGMNEDGLAISLTFGGRKEVGEGFGIPFILRYVLEFSSNVEEAVEALTRVPSHMSYNVTVLDKTGACKTVHLAPDKAPLVTDAVFTTNHQGQVDWPENALFNQTVERSAFLERSLSEEELDADKLAAAFLQAPLYNTRFAEGFGTIYTAVYRPAEGTVQIRWPNETVRQSFDAFQEQYKLIKYNQPAPTAVPVPATAIWEQVPADAAQWIPQPSNGSAATATDWQEAVADTIVNSMAQNHMPEGQKNLKSLRKNMLRRGQISWEILADYWANIGRGYWEKWRK